VDNPTEQLLAMLLPEFESRVARASGNEQKIHTQ